MEVECEQQDLRRADDREVAVILREFEQCGEAMRSLNRRGQVVWRASPQMLDRLRAMLRAMSETGGGAIVNTASTAGLKCRANMGAYGASKHAVIGLTRCAAIEGAASGIRVNAVCPGVIDTRMPRTISAELGGNPDQQLSALVPKQGLARMGRPEEVANLVAWLLSNEASYG